MGIYTAGGPRATGIALVCMAFIFIVGGVIGSLLVGKASWGLDFFLLAVVFGCGGGVLLWKSSDLEG